ncbi:MAG: PcfK-like family protein, partial [Ruminococcus sp.]|nr:PcfK-like family protein [Ruminococcus sp.]
DIMTYSIEDYGKDFTKLALEKLAEETKNYKGDRYGNAVYKHVAETLEMFINRSEEFATVFYKTKRSFSDCVAKIMKGCGQCISDIEVYRRAAKFYFPDSEVEFQMIIKVGKMPDDKYIEKVEKPRPTDKAQEKVGKEAKPKKAAPTKAKPQEIQMTLF